MPSVSQNIRDFARGSPDRTAMTFEGRMTSYRNMNFEADRIAAALSASGLRPGDRWAYLGANSDVFFSMVIAAIRSGTCLVPVNWRLSSNEARFVLTNSESRLLFCDRGNLAFATELAETCGLPTATPVHADQDHDPFGAWLETGGASPAEAPEDPDADFLQLYTSGTTGEPKGVLITNGLYTGHLERLATVENRSIRPYPEDVTLLSMPVFHVSGAGVGLELLHAGGTVSILRSFEARAALERITTDRVTRAFLVPAALRMMLEDPEITSYDLSTLRDIHYGGGPISADLREQAWAVLSCGFTHCYGMTETAGNICVLEPEDGHDLSLPKATSVGRPLTGTRIRIVGKSGDVLGVGMPGEIQVSAVSNTPGYWHRPDATEKLFSPDGWLKTGDVGEIDDEGYLYIRERLTDMIISGGENIYPKEVESVVVGHESVYDVSVIGAPDPKWGEIVVAFIVLRPDHAVTESDLIEWLRPRLSGYKRPRFVRFVEALPRTASGKVQRKALRDIWSRSSGPTQ